MNALFQSLAEQFRSTSILTKGIAVMVALALVALTYTASTLANRPHFEIFTSGVDDVDAAKITKALAEASIPFELSQPPGPYVIYVDESDRHKAFAVVASSGALEHAPRGILGNDGGMATVFMSSGERAQVVQKREWQEVETLLVNGLDFVAGAKVQTSSPSSRVLGRDEPRSGSVTVQVRGGAPLTRTQAATVADLVRFSMRIDPANLFIADQSGRSGFRGSDVTSDGSAASSPMEHKLEFDRRTSEEITQLLAGILGPGLARVTVASEWDHDFSTRITETSNPDAKVAISETSETTETPQWHGASSGAMGVGTSSNLGNEFGIDSSNVAESSPGSPTGAHVLATTTEQKTQYFAPHATEQIVRTTPTLRKLSISLFLDESLASRATALGSSVKAAVGFNEIRNDTFSVTTLPFAGATPVEGETPAAEPVAEPLSPMVETLLRRGVEILSALVFLFIVVRSLKGAKQLLAQKPATRGGSAAGPGRVESDLPDVPMEVLARAQVEDILNSNPEKIGQILSSWAREEAPAA